MRAQKKFCQKECDKKIKPIYTKEWENCIKPVDTRHTMYNYCENEHMKDNKKKKACYVTP